MSDIEKCGRKIWMQMTLNFIHLFAMIYLYLICWADRHELSQLNDKMEAGNYRYDTDKKINRTCMVDG